MLRSFANKTACKMTMARTFAQRRQYTVEELKNNNWLLPDENCTV